MLIRNKLSLYLVMPLFNCPYLRFLFLCEDPGSSLDCKLLPSGYRPPAEEPLPELCEPPLLHLTHISVEETISISVVKNSQILFTEYSGFENVLIGEYQMYSVVQCCHMRS